MKGNPSNTAITRYEYLFTGQNSLLILNTIKLTVMKILIRLLDDYKAYGKHFQVDPYSNYDVTPKTTKYYNPAFILKLLVW